MTSSRLERPPRPTFFTKRRRAVVGAAARTRLRQLALQVLDRVPGRCPLQTHVVMCGFPRSGSTLLQLVAEGLSNKRIAARLGISEHTAKFHVNAILGKLGAQTRAEAVAQAVRLGLLLL